MDVNGGNITPGLARESDSFAELELRASPLPTLIVLLIIGPLVHLVMTLILDYSGEIPARVMAFSLPLMALAAIGWLILGANDLAGRWFTTVLVVVVFLGVGLYVRIPGAWALLAIPVALTAAQISVLAAAAIAVGETVLLGVLLSSGYEGLALPEIGVALTAIWAGLGVMYAAYWPVQRAREYFDRSQGLLEDARARQVELRQALDDLADVNVQYTRLNTMAQSLRRVAEQARTVKEQFVANVSHELRTPLNMIVGFSELIRRAPEAYGDHVPPPLLADLAVIHRNAAHLSELIDDVLDLSQIEAEEMALAKENVQFHELVDAATVAVSPLFDSKGLYIETDVPKDLPLVFCDRTRIREVLLNLLSNAGRFTERGGVHVRAWQDQNDLIVAVVDSGPGIAADDMERLFQPFQQLDGSIRRRYGGTGLGLNISKRFVDLHGGKIWVESEKDAGATFFFRLPLTPAGPVGPAFRRGFNPGWEYVQRTHPSMSPDIVVRPRLVVLEKENSLQRLLARYLDGVEIVPVANLEDAVRFLMDNPSQALLVNDVSVAGALERVGSVELPYGTPVMICSIPGMLESAAALGVSNYLVKPISRDNLLDALGRLGVRAGTILIVDDEPEALRLFRRILTSSGRDYRVLRARDGLEALNVLRRQRPDAILLDLVMPNMDGFRLLEVKSQDPALSDIPVIAVSARDPAGQPIVSKSLAITRDTGLTVYQLLAYVRTIGTIFSTGERSAGLTPPAIPPD